MMQRRIAAALGAAPEDAEAVAPLVIITTTGDRVRLGDTDIIIEVERDLTTYGEEVKFGGGKVIRDDREGKYIL